MGNLQVEVLEPETARACLRVLSWLFLVGGGQVETDGPAKPADIAEYTRLSEEEVGAALRRLRDSGFIAVGPEHRKILEFPSRGES